MRVEEKQLVHESTLYVRRAYMRESPRKGVIPMCVYYEWGELLVKQLKGELPILFSLVPPTSPWQHSKQQNGEHSFGAGSLLPCRPQSAHQAMFGSLCIYSLSLPAGPVFVFAEAMKLRVAYYSCKSSCLNFPNPVITDIG